MQENPDAVVVTIDDDVLYPPHMLYELYRSYLQYPDCVSAARGDLIMVTDERKLLPYNSWLQSLDSGKHIPSMHILAIGCAGILYPPGLLKKEFFNKEAIMETCLFADDLWLKFMEVMCDVPTVISGVSLNLQYVPDSQGENALWRTNVTQQQNDVWLANIFRWMDEHYGEGVAYKKLTCPSVGSDWAGVEAIGALLTDERNILIRDNQRNERKLKKAYEQISNYKERLQQSWDQASNYKERLQQSWDQISNYKERLQLSWNQVSDYKERLQLSWDQNKKLREQLAEANQRIERLEKMIPILWFKKTRIGKMLQKLWNRIR